MAMIVLFSWMAILLIGKRLPYLELQSSYLVRSWLLFAVLSGLLFHEIFLRSRKSGTAMQQHLRAYPGRRRRAFQLFVVSSGVILFPAFLAITSGNFPALATQLFARRTFADAYVVEGADGNGRHYYTVRLRGDGGEQSYFNVARRAYPAATWSTGNRVCIHGRSWMLGRAVRGVEVGFDHCEM